MGNEKIPVQEHSGIIEMYVGGMTQEQIAQKYNVRNTTISCILSKYFKETFSFFENFATVQKGRTYMCKLCVGACS